MTDEKLNNGCAVALGNFDGIHTGHMAVLDKTLEWAEHGLIPTVMLFDEHSMKVVAGEAPPRLMSEKERNEILAKKGIKAVIVSFSEIKEFEPEKFVEEILVKKLNAKVVVCGFNYRFGKNAKGDAKLLEKICTQKGIRCVIIEEIETDKLPVSSTSIRLAVEKGEIELANKMLGRCFGFSSEVINGDKRGRTWGFPTANQKIPQGLTIPAFGVYETQVSVDGRVFKGITNIGTRPTVGTDGVLSETHILGFNESLYGKTVDIRLIRFIRPEQKFNSFDELSLQIKADVLNVKGGV